MHIMNLSPPVTQTASLKERQSFSLTKSSTIVTGLKRMLSKNKDENSIKSHFTNTGLVAYHLLIVQLNTSLPTHPAHDLGLAIDPQ